MEYIRENSLDNANTLSGNVFWPWFYFALFAKIIFKSIRLYISHEGWL